MDFHNLIKKEEKHLLMLIEIEDNMKIILIKYQDKNIFLKYICLALILLIIIKVNKVVLRKEDPKKFLNILIKYSIKVKLIRFKVLLSNLKEEIIMFNLKYLLLLSTRISKFKLQQLVIEELQVI